MINQQKEAERYKKTQHIHDFAMFGQQIKLYSKSYLNYGLMTARESIFTNETTDNNQINSYQLVSRCVPDNLEGKFKFQNMLWTVKALAGNIFQKIFLQK